ncbi:MAG: hypothetical protein ACLTLQ_09345 [[Clostridium] scindens]
MLAAKRKYDSRDATADYEQTQKHTGYLMRKGFSMDIRRHPSDVIASFMSENVSSDIFVKTV